MTDCACGSGRDHDACCGPFLAGEARPATAEELLRSRYTAFTRKQTAYVVDTTHPDQLEQLDRESIEAWAENADWKELEIHRVEGGAADQDEGCIDFTARFEEDGEEVEHTERAWFVKHEGAWVFDHRRSGTPQLEAGEKIGRNEPCPCGSGKKYKKCCGKAA